MRLKKCVIKLLIDDFFVFTLFFFLFFLYKNQEMCDRIVFEDPFILIYGSDQYNVR